MKEYEIQATQQLYIIIFWHLADGLIWSDLCRLHLWHTIYVYSKMFFAAAIQVKHLAQGDNGSSPARNQLATLSYKARSLTIIVYCPNLVLMRHNFRSTMTLGISLLFTNFFPDLTFHCWPTSCSNVSTPADIVFFSLLARCWAIMNLLKTLECFPQGISGWADVQPRILCPSSPITDCDRIWTAIVVMWT